MLNISLSFILAFLIAFYAIPSIIRVAFLKRLYDDPALEERKIHKYQIPNLGGMAVMMAFAFSACFFISGSKLPYANYIFAASLLIFSMGTMDDLAGLGPYKKFLAQFVSAFIVVYYGDIRISNFDGLLGIYQLHPVISHAFSMLLVVFIINAFNLIDGINGLLGCVGMIAGLTMGVTFYQMDQTGLALLGFSLAGAILGFLWYNIGNHARIFMGDAGAYTIGLLIAVLALKFIELNLFTVIKPADEFVTPLINSAPAVAIAILIIPVYDTIRVFLMRLAAGKSPFQADRKHLHHRLLEIGMTHIQATVVLAGVNLFMIALTLAFQSAGTAELLLLIGIVTFLLNALLWLYDVKVDKELPNKHLNEQLTDNIGYGIKGHAKQVAEDAMQQNKN